MIDIYNPWFADFKEPGSLSWVTEKNESEKGLSVKAVPYKKEITIFKEPKKVIFNPPATIVFWADGSKTVVKCHNEEFDPEKGVAMALCKKIYKEKYHSVLKKFVYKEK